MTGPPFESLDYVYTPSRDVAADATYLTDVVGGRVVFAIEAMGTRVAAIELAAERPWVVFADHLEGDRPILVWRVASLAKTAAVLEDRGWQSGASLEIPQGPCRTFDVPGGQRFAIYELSRPGVVASFEGRRDF